MSNTMPLKYIFQATFKDGSIYTSNQEDVSITEPELRSCFYDIQDRMEDVKSFFVFNNEHRYSVNLEDGHFEIDGIPFFMHEDAKLKDFRLIYFRRHTHNFDSASGKEFDHFIDYCFGWQTNDKDGKNVQRVMTIY